ncbi:MAG: glycosyltransferase family 2 protein [Deltaproteobacteria bacterium]|nr:glycosyltransferase family 2 protein [Deltaproteobacteria bacterium]
MPELLLNETMGPANTGIETSTTARQPLVSIVLAVLNGANAIHKTLESVFSQTYREKELLIVDGGSTDGTLELIGENEGSIDYWVSEPDGGIYDAFNKGVRLARGDWLYFMGAGDFFVDQTVLQRLLTPAPRGKLVYGNVVWGDTQKLYDGAFSKWKLCGQNICHQAILYNRGLFQKWGGFDTQYRLWADWAFNMKCFGSPDTEPEYKNITVAHYDRGGASSRSLDELFLADKTDLIRDSLGRRYELRLRLHLFKKSITRPIERRVEKFVKSQSSRFFPRLAHQAKRDAP